MTNHKTDQQTARDEHNDVASAKRTLGVFYNPETAAYSAMLGNAGGVLVNDYFFQVSDGNVTSHSAVSLIGTNPSVGVSNIETVWEENGSEYVFPVSASTMTVSSSDANDTSAGTGCRTILIQGLDTDYVESQEFVTLNGTTAVTTVNSYLRINFMTCFTFGTGLQNAGNIFIGTGTVTAGKPANVYGKVSIGEGISHTAVYTVPANKEFFLIRGNASSDSGKQIDLFIDSRPFTLGRGRVRGTTYSISGGTIELNYIPSTPFSQKTDILINSIATTGGAGECRVNFAGILKG